jgi:hypothetical protein
MPTDAMSAQAYRQQTEKTTQSLKFLHNSVEELENERFILEHQYYNIKSRNRFKQQKDEKE